MTETGCTRDLFVPLAMVAVLLVVLLVFVGAGGAAPVSVAESDTGVGSAPDEQNTTAAGNTAEDPAALLSPGKTVVYDFGNDSRLDTDAPAPGDSNATSPYTPLPDTVGPDDDRQRVERPWDTLTYHNSVVQVQMSLAGGGESSCTGTIVGEYHVLTAGHCVYLDGSWVDEVSVVPMIDTQAGTTVEPYGSAEVRIARTYQAWVDRETGVPQHDLALLTLDRSLGDTEGTRTISWAAYPEGDPVYTQDSVLNLGYPGDPPDNGPLPSLWENSGQGLGEYNGQSGTFEVDIVVTGGHSGGPLFHETSLGGYEQIGIAAYTTYGTAFGPRFTFDKSADLANWTTATSYVDPPEDKPEYVLERPSYTGESDTPFDVTPTDDIVPGETELTVEHAVRNVGTARGPNSIGIALRTVSDGTCTRSGRVLHNETVPTPGAFDSTDVAFTATLPANVSEPVDVCLTVESGADEFDDRPPAHNVSSVERLSLFEPPAVETSLGDATADPGETVSIPLEVEPRADPTAEVGAYDVELTYDDAALSFVDADGEALPDPVVSDEGGVLSLNGFQGTGEQVPLTAVTLEFAVDGDASDGVAPFEFNPERSVLLDPTTRVPSAFEHGGVAIGDAPYPATLRNQIGDVDTDQAVDIVDPVLIQQQLAEMQPDPFTPGVADVNRDGDVTVVDAVLLQQSLAGLVEVGTLGLSNLSVDSTNGTVSVAVTNNGGLGAVQTVELRVAGSKAGLVESTTAETQIVDLPGGDGTAVTLAAETGIDPGDWVQLSTADQTVTTQVSNGSNSSPDG